MRLRLSSWWRRLRHRRLHQKFKHSLFENLGLKLLALLIALILFVVSRQPMREVLLVGVPIEFRDRPAGLEISGEVAQSVSVRLRGPQDVVRNMTANQIAIIADLSNKEPGERVVQLKTAPATIPENVRVLRIDPASIKLRLEPIAHKEVPVEPKFIGELPPEYEVYSFSAVPASVVIEGPQSHVARITQVSTESIQLEGHLSSFKTTVEVDPPDRFVRVTTPGPINLSIEIGERRSERQFSRLPVKWVDRPPRGRLLTSTVDVCLYGPRSAIEALTASDLKVEISTATLSEATNIITPSVRLPENAHPRIEVKRIVPNQVKVKR